VPLRAREAVCCAAALLVCAAVYGWGVESGEEDLIQKWSPDLTKILDSHSKPAKAEYHLKSSSGAELQVKLECWATNLDRSWIAKISLRRKRFEIRLASEFNGPNPYLLVKERQGQWEFETIQFWRSAFDGYGFLGRWLWMPPNYTPTKVK